MLKNMKNIKASSLVIAIASILMMACFGYTSLYSQITINPGYEEEFFLQTDRDIYFTGEEVLVKVSKFNRLSGTLGDFSKVGYVDMYNKFGNPIAQVKVDLESFSGASRFRIPDTIGSGNYYVRAYSSWMRNFPRESFAYRTITVINPFENIDALLVKPSDFVGDSLALDSQPRIDTGIAANQGNNTTTSSGKTIRIMDENPGTRDRVEIRIEGVDADDPGFSIAVVKSVLLDDNGYSEKDPYDAGSFVFNLAEAKYMPELDGNVISGTIRDNTTNEPLANTNVMLSFIGKNARCQFSRSDADGRFNFFIGEKGVLNVVISPVSESITDYYVELTDPFELSVPENLYSPVYIDTAKLEELNEAIIGMQIRNIYDPYLGPDSVAPEQYVVNNFYGEPDNTVYLSDYIELTTLREVVKEIVPGVWTQRRNKQLSLKLLNKYPTGAFYKSPMVLFDGVPVRDIDEVLHVRASEIERIDIFNTRYFVSDIIMEGIVHFISKKGDMSMMEYDKSIFRQLYNSVDNSKLYYPEYSTAELKAGRIPDYRNTLYWDPFITANGSGEAVVDFYTADEEGDYTVIVEGFSKDGLYFRDTAGFKVTRR